MGEEITETIQQMGEENPQARLLTSIPDIGHYSALLIVSEIGEIQRFPNARKLCSYAGALLLLREGDPLG